MLTIELIVFLISSLGVIGCFLLDGEDGSFFVGLFVYFAACIALTAFIKDTTITEMKERAVAEGVAEWIQTVNDNGRYTTEFRYITPDNQDSE